MVAKASIIEIYARADAAGRVDIICKNYSNFIGIVDGYTEANAVYKVKRCVLVNTEKVDEYLENFCECQN